MFTSALNAGKKVAKIFFLGFFCLTLFALMIIFVSRGLGALREVENHLETAPLSGGFIKVNDVNIFFQESGPANGQVVVLIHGTGAWSEIWRETIDELAENGFRAIAIDIPPFGYSSKLVGPEAYTREKQAARIEKFLEALDIKDPILVGHSVGARPALEVALKNPSSFRKLVLVDPALGFSIEEIQDPVFVHNKASFMVRAIFSFDALQNSLLMTYGTNPFSIKKLFSSFVFKKESVTSARVDVLKKPLVLQGITQGYGDWLENLLVSSDSSLGSDFLNFKTLTMPALIIWGDSDTITPLWQGYALQKMIPFSEIAVLKNVGHIPYVEDVEMFNSILLDFISKK